MITEESVQTAEYQCTQGEDCPCPVLELVNGKVLFVGTPCVDCTHNIAYGDGRVCTCAKRNEMLSVSK